MSAKKIASKPADELLEDVRSTMNPLEQGASLAILVDRRTGARYCECHVKAQYLVEHGTTDVPLDPDAQAEYRANRDVVENSTAFARMKEDAANGRSFSNIVGEFTTEFDPDHPFKIIGGQHRFEAIRSALADGVNEYHGIKVYLGLDLDQRLDVQLISNTNIAISTDLFDRMQETAKGPKLREWCQEVGLLEAGVDFADRRARGGPISVQVARTFILNYFRGSEVDTNKFVVTDTTPVISVTGNLDEDWDKLCKKHPKLWSDPDLRKAAMEFASLVKAQRNAFVKPKKFPPDFPEKAFNIAVLGAWAYVAGMVRNNAVRLKRHNDLCLTTNRDPLNAAALAAGSHRTDPDNYRGLGYRTDAKERGRLVELFSLQAEEGGGITPGKIDIAIKRYHAKQAQLEVLKAEHKEQG